MDAPSAQLAQDLRDAVVQSLQKRRPLLHHLNGDSSWLLQIPRPTVDDGRYWYNILIDPWLQGGQSDVAWWFSQQFHASESKVGSIAAVEELARETEILTAGLRLGKGRVPNGQEASANLDSFIDAVAVSHEFTDHCHKATLLEVSPSIPVFATAKAADLIRSWNHFESVQNIPPFPGKSVDWRDASLAPLPSWIGIARLTTKDDFLYYHSAVMFVFNTSDSTDEESAEAIVYTPHGITPRDVAVVTKATPPIQTLAFLHGLHDISLGPQLNLGAHNGLEAQRQIHAKYWIGTHDEMKQAGGMIRWFLKRKVISVMDALEDEAKKTTIRNGKEDNLEAVLREINFMEIDNGESLVLE